MMEEKDKISYIICYDKFDVKNKKFLNKTSMTNYLTDTSILVNNDISEIVKFFIDEQNKSSETYVFGGPVPYKSSIYDEYLKSIIKLVSSKTCKSFILTYINYKNKETNYFWLMFCSKLNELYPDNFKFKFTLFDSDYLPFSFHAYSTFTVHFGLRLYSIEYDKRCINTSFVVRNENIYKLILDEFSYNFQNEKNTSDIAHNIENIIDLKEEINRKIIKLFED